MNHFRYGTLASADYLPTHRNVRLAPPTQNSLYNLCIEILLAGDPLELSLYPPGGARNSSAFGLVKFGIIGLWSKLRLHLDGPALITTPAVLV